MSDPCDYPDIGQWNVVSPLAFGVTIAGRPEPSMADILQTICERAETMTPAPDKADYLRELRETFDPLTVQHEFGILCYECSRPVTVRQRGGEWWADCENGHRMVPFLDRYGRYTWQMASNQKESTHGPS